MEWGPRCELAAAARGSLVKEALQRESLRARQEGWWREEWGFCVEIFDFDEANHKQIERVYKS